MVNQTIEIWSLDLAGIKEIMVFQCTAKLVESLASPATSFATKQMSGNGADTEVVLRRRQGTFSELLEMSTEFSADKFAT